MADDKAATVSGPVAVVGAGSIGVAWAVVFASGGFDVRLHDVSPERLVAAEGEILEILDGLVAGGLVTEPAATIAARVTASASLDDAVEGVTFVQECIVEDVELKQALFARLDELAPPAAVLASSTSTIMPSAFAEHVPGRHRCLVVHPGNPPYFLRVAEVVPAPFTSPQAVQRAVTLVDDLGMSSVVLTTEIEGFVFNRLQGALLREAYCLVRDGVVSPVDVDTLVREGLGLRWSILGPFATNELNTRGGLRQHAELHGRVYARLGIERSTDDPWTPETIDRVAAEIQASLPHADWAANVKERDRAMVAVATLLRDFDNPLARPEPRQRHAVSERFVESRTQSSRTAVGQ